VNQWLETSDAEPDEITTDLITPGCGPVFLAGNGGRVRWQLAVQSLSWRARFP